MRTTILIMVFSMLHVLGGCAMDGGPGLILDRAWWRDPGVLRVSLWAASGAAFELEEEDGTRLPGVADCLNERCLLTFEGASEPKLLWHRTRGVERAAPLLECSQDPFGLCPLGYTCVDRVCEPVCSTTHPGGACIEDGAVCDDGWCTIADC